MNKFILSLVALFIGVGLVSASDRREETYSTLEVTAASGTIFTGAGWVKSVQLSTPTEGTVYGTQWLVLINTQPPANVPYSAFSSASKKSVPLIYTSTPSISGSDRNANQNIFTWPEPGIFCSTGAYYFKTSASSGEAFKAVINYKQ